MFERFTESARTVVVRAQEHAKALHSSEIHGVHLLLGVLTVEEEGDCAPVLVSLGVTKKAFYDKLEQIVGKSAESDQSSKPKGQQPWTPRAKRVLEFSAHEALKLGHNYVGPGHILLGSLRESDSTVVKVLEELGVDPSNVREEVIESFASGNSAAGHLKCLEIHVHLAQTHVPSLEKLAKDSAVLGPEPERIKKELERIERRLKKFRVKE